MSAIFWITGLSGSGKTTLGKSLSSRLREIKNRVIFLDGDKIRDVFDLDSSNEQDPFSREKRLELAKKYVNLCKLIYEQDFTIVISTICLFKEIFKLNRESFENYCEIFLDIDIETLKERDPKGLYKGYFQGTINNITGLDLKADYPDNAHIVFKSIDSQKGNEWMTTKVLECSNKFVEL